MKSLIPLILTGTVALHAAPLIATAPIEMNGTVSVVQSAGDKELTWVDEQIQAILPARIGVTDGLIGSLIDPMKMKKAIPVASKSNLLAPPKLGGNGLALPPKMVEEPLRLQALINKSALINGKWYKQNDPVRSFVVSEVKSCSVLLIGKKEQKLILFLTKQNNKIKFTTK